MTNKKPTKKEMFNKILAHTTDETEKAFILHEIELLDKKAGKGEGKALTKEQLENEKVKEAILKALADGSKMTIGSMNKMVPECNGFSTSKTSSLVRQLKVDGKVVREEVKGVAYFYLAQ